MKVKTKCAKDGLGVCVTYKHFSGYEFFSTTKHRPHPSTCRQRKSLGDLMRIEVGENVGLPIQST